MRLLTYVHSKNQEKVGILGKHGVIDALAAWHWLKEKTSHAKQDSPPIDMLTVIRHQDTLLPDFRSILSAEEEGTLPLSFILNEADLKIISPIPRPVSMRDGYAFRQHVESARKGRGLPMIPEFDLFPVFYFTNHLAVTGPGDVFVQKMAQERLDFELEAAIVIGRECKNVSAEDADEMIFGYTIMNDWSARALQTEEMKLNLGPAKGKDFATSLGPYLITRDELSPKAIPSAKGERHDLRMKAFLNGNQLSDGNMKDMNWTFGQILERASYGVTLQPGEVIGSGTVGTGCLMELNGSKITDNLWLKPGDEMVLEIEGMGRLVNRVVAAD